MFSFRMEFCASFGVFVLRAKFRFSYDVLLSRTRVLGRVVFCFVCRVACCLFVVWCFVLFVVWNLK